MGQRFHPAKKNCLGSLSCLKACLLCLSMLTLLKHAYSTRLKFSKHAKMSAIIKLTHVFVRNSFFAKYFGKKTLLRHYRLYFITVRKKFLSRINRIYYWWTFSVLQEHYKLQLITNYKNRFIFTKGIKMSKQSFGLEDVN
jgi:hypothetical protein